MNNFTIRSFSKAIVHGTKFIYRTIPRLLTIWLDVGEDRNFAGQDTFKKMTESVAQAIKDAPAYKVCVPCSSLASINFWASSGTPLSLK